eukprot:g19798.t1
MILPAASCAPDCVWPWSRGPRLWLHSHRRLSKCQSCQLTSNAGVARHCQTAVLKGEVRCTRASALYLFDRFKDAATAAGITEFGQANIRSTTSNLLRKT